MTTRTHHFIVLLSGIDWKYPLHSEFILSKGIRICKFKKSPAEKLYLMLCRKFKFDEGSPFIYNTYLYVELLSDPEHIPHELGPDSTISRLCNIIAITINGPISWYRIISVTKELKYAGFTEDVSFTHAAEALELKTKPLTIESLKNIKTLWNSDRFLRKDYISNSRIINSLDYYFYAWRSWNLEQTCINLAIVLETLFSPTSTTELSHRIAYNACRFMGYDTTRREHIYSMLKKYYNLRSQIVHCSQPNYEKLIESTQEIIIFCANVLNRILLDKELLSTFNDNKKRQDLFNNWLFE